MLLGDLQEVFVFLAVNVYSSYVLLGDVRKPVCYWLLQFTVLMCSLLDIYYIVT
jgi:hypothetical protein